MELIERILAGDKYALENLVNSMWEDLYFIAKARVKNKYKAGEAMQDTFVALLENINNIKDVNKIKKWCVTVLINNCNRIMRTQNKVLSYEEIRGGYLDKSENFFERLEKNMNFLDLISFLEEEDRIILSLHYRDDYTTREIAEILQMNESTIRSKMKRARNKIKLKIGDGKNDR